MDKPVMIKVTGKINAGIHPIHGPIVKGQEYTINENDFGDQLFDRPAEPKGWVSPQEKKKAAAEKKSAATAPVADKAKK